ncbi:dephospho-CoA kinase [Epilithonimonas arachidiradicis]|uniref:Dephospho-CoA kinase n=1 Tax=Epilithonimonas arachidiradicis TaxID=1617282 RepID=A0A420DB20_9FLAO|nr:dephospho-CoA kinase [Epilithonimonas arachidiradicis]GGG55148.1 dephospho-CoA kinase [Epilithonimonas arachidiradicis]
MEIQEINQNQEEDVPIPKIIGLTGGIGSGKTSVAKLLEEKGFPVYYSDDEAKNIVNKDSALKEKIIELLGIEAYIDGFYNRKYVAEKVFNNSELLEQLNHLIHPAVRIDFENWVKAQNSEYVFKETALLFELKLNQQCYKSLLITADDNLRIKRTMDRDGKTYREVEAIIQKQMPEKEKCKLANYIIYNNSDFESLRIATEAFIEELE